MEIGWLDRISMLPRDCKVPHAIVSSLICYGICRDRVREISNLWSINGCTRAIKRTVCGSSAWISKAASFTQCEWMKKSRVSLVE